MRRCISKELLTDAKFWSSYLRSRSLESATSTAIAGATRDGLDRRYGAALVTYADDFVVLCWHGATEVLETTRRWMAGIGLALDEDKTRVCNTPDPS